MEIWTSFSEPLQAAILVALGLMLGIALSFLLLRHRRLLMQAQITNLLEQQQETALQLQQRELLLERAQTDQQSLQSEYDKTVTRLSFIENELDQLRRIKQQLDRDSVELRTANSALEATLSAEQKRAEEHISLLKDAKERLTLEFKQLANEIFEEKGRRFTEQNKQNLESVLKPLSGQIKDFQQRVEDSYDKESKDRFSLIKEIKNLQELNSRISVDAVNLTNALKGESKTQGTWGELKLERILEASGLVKGREYEIQVSLRNDQGARLQPDVVVHLPDRKDVIIDSKVTLTAYHRYVSAETDGEREQQAQLHLQALQKHIKDLSGKDYQNIEQLRTLDFVLMFLPIEDAFHLAMQHDPDLFSRAFEHNIILVGPSNLLATLRTIQHIWRNEYQTQNAQEIARKAGDLYDKFVGFVGDLEEIGVRLGKAQEAYDKAHNKLTSGRGNLVGRTENLKRLGAKTSKALPQKLVSKSDPDLELVDLSADSASSSQD